MDPLKDQRQEKIPVKKLILWTENPRDTIDPNAKDQDIVNLALKSDKWKLRSLIKEMGAYYDLSEVPTVVYEGGKPVVYDGNRRMILAKIKLNLVEVELPKKTILPDFPEKIMCNVCTKEVALNNLLRKHGNSGSWSAIEKEKFLVKFMGQQPSAFYLIDEYTGSIIADNNLNQRFVKDEIFSRSNLERFGINVEDGRLHLKYDINTLKEILSAISSAIQNGELSTRNKRNQPFEALDLSIREKIDSFATFCFTEIQPSKVIPLSQPSSDKPKKNERRPRRVSTQSNTIIFGGPLELKSGSVGNLYRDICDIYDLYQRRKKEGKRPLSESFPGIIRMALRLLCETAAEKSGVKLDLYFQNNFDAAKTMLDQDQKTSLANQSVCKESIVKLLHTGAHNYTASTNMDQTMAMSLIIGKILINTFGHNIDAK